MINNVLDYLWTAGTKTPGTIAFADKDKSITFGELVVAVRRVAAAVEAATGRGKNRPFAVYMDKSVDALVAYLGIVCSGNFYVPIDTKSPVDRVERILSILQPAGILYADSSQTMKGTWASVFPFESKPEFDAQNQDAHLAEVLDTDPLYVLFTSGSTGLPKGVVISHQSVIDYTEWLADTFGFGGHTVFGNQAPFYFDNSILDIYCTLKSGCRIQIIPEKLFMFPASLAAYINETCINTLFWVPSALINMANSGVLEKVPMPALEKVLFCGEVMPNRQLNMWRQSYPNLLYANLYGPTEITDACSCYIVDRPFADEEPLPIGLACRNTEILVLNDQNEPAVGDEAGELCVRGSNLALGYYGDFEKSSSVFMQNPLNPNYRDMIYRTGDIVRRNERGELIFLSRKDFQIKHQGHRIELGEIETVASACSGVQHGCALYDDANKRIVLFCMMAGHTTDKEIASFMAQKLPQYMLPGKILLLEALPLTLNGKIDRLRLKEMM